MDKRNLRGPIRQRNKRRQAITTVNRRYRVRDHRLPVEPREQPEAQLIGVEKDVRRDHQADIAPQHQAVLPEVG